MKNHKQIKAILEKVYGPLKGESVDEELELVGRFLSHFLKKHRNNERYKDLIRELEKLYVSN